MEDSSAASVDRHRAERRRSDSVVAENIPSVPSAAAAESQRSAQVTASSIADGNIAVNPPCAGAGRSSGRRRWRSPTRGTVTPTPWTP